jgi:hypothetical protein
MKSSCQFVFSHSVLLCTNLHSITPSFYSLSFGILLTYIDAARTRITENTCHVFAVQPVHWRSGWTYRKHFVAAKRCWDVMPLHMFNLHGHKENTAAVVLVVCVLRTLPSNGFTFHSINDNGDFLSVQ